MYKPRLNVMHYFKYNQYTYTFHSHSTVKLIIIVQLFDIHYIELKLYCIMGRWPKLLNKYIWIFEQRERKRNRDRHTEKRRNKPVGDMAAREKINRRNNITTGYMSISFSRNLPWVWGTANYNYIYTLHRKHFPAFLQSQCLEYDQSQIRLDASSDNI